MSDFVTAFQSATEAALSEVNTAAPGVLVSYDPASNRAVVRASLPKALADGRDLEPPNIHEVAVAWPKGGGMLTTWPLRPGDGMMLLFAQRSLEGWLSGNDSAPDDPRRFDLADCVAVPGLTATGISADPDAVQCEFDGTTVRLEPGGVSRITGTKVYITADIEHVGNVVQTGNFDQTGNYIQTGDFSQTGNVGTTGQVYAATDVRGGPIGGSVSLRSHAHSASGGSGIGGPPVPT